MFRKECLPKELSKVVWISKGLTQIAPPVRSIVVVGSRAYVYFEHGQLEQRKTSSSPIAGRTMTLSAPDDPALATVCKEKLSGE